ncbi:hypothetical protein LMG31884_46470 (plasmid) [Xanthomonas hydrangeae]|uniref:hypothetical protein n=1 Tax=Xanthomonas hydrangeae TaxID=2775159 RepID=UPI001AF440E2|nr:hypothetical protein LMG31884_46470 [Xanthomonas hydrangeae]CAD7740285.1 hypothetical protein LMG31884_46470 [Xanthomonas hydrangeae]
MTREFRKDSTIVSSGRQTSPIFKTVGELKALLQDLPDEAAIEIDKLPIGTQSRGLVLIPEPAAEVVTICEST